MNVKEKEYLARVAELGCLVCNSMGYDSPAEIHHIRSGQGMGQRASHFDAIPLCHAHHRTGGYGVAFHAGPKIWQEKYGTETEMLHRVQNALDDIA